MTLEAGTLVAHYRILSKLGQGGMGDVYLAEDTRLGRQVALKFLPPDLASDRERLLRFEREAKALAALNHPGIVTLHSLEQADGVHFLTMERVEGRTLDHTLGRGGLSIERFFEIAIPLAEAVGAAHARGITHRDLKPANVMLTADGRTKVLDFGLAKLREPVRAGAASAASGQTTQTEEGRILGTVAYMSPEQAEGKEIDPRSDVFSLGILLYEMAGGERPFGGESGLSVLSSILRDAPPSLSQVNRRVPRRLARIVQRCLQKDPARRYQSVLDLRNDLEECRDDIASGEIRLDDAPALAAPTPAWRRTPTLVGLGLLLGVSFAILFSLLVSQLSGDGSDRVVNPFQLRRLTTLPGLEITPSLSSDGRRLVYSGDAEGDFDLYLQRVGGQTAVLLTPGSDDQDIHPAFAPDGERIAFVSTRGGGGLFVMGATGEDVRRVGDMGFHPAWSPDGKQLAYCTEGIRDPRSREFVSQLWIVDVESGAKRLLYGGDGVQPSWSPDGRLIAFWTNRNSQRDVMTMPAAGGEPVAVTNDSAVDWCPVWTRDGKFLLFSSDRGGVFNFWRVRVDPETGQRAGMIQSVTTGSDLVGWPSLSADGRRMAYTVASTSDLLWRGALDADPAASKAPERFDLPGIVGGITDVSADGKRFLIYSVDGVQEHILVHDVEGARSRALVATSAKDRGPRWSPTDDRIAFYSNRSGSWEAWSIRTDGSGLQQLTDVAERSILGPCWSPDGSQLVVTTIGNASASGGLFLVDSRKLSKAADLEPLAPFTGEGTVVAIDWSADGSRLLLSRQDSLGKRSLLTYSFASRAYETLVVGPPGGRFLPDGQRVLAVSFGELVLIDVASRALLARWPMQSTELSTGVAIVPGGREYYVSATAVSADVWLLDEE